MQTNMRLSLCAGLLPATMLSSLLLTPLGASAQATFFGSGSATNSTPNTINLAFGYKALYSNTTGQNNIALGYQAGQNITTGSNNIAIGNMGLPTDAAVIRIGTTGVQKSTFIAGINGVTVGGEAGVYIDTNGQLGTIVSSRRFKKDIHPMGSVTDRLMQLRPVTFHYKKATADGGHPLQYGLIAEEVAKVYPDLVQYDKEGKPFTVYYHLLTPMLLNELQKEHRQNVAMKTQYRSEIVSLKSTHESDRAEITTLKTELASLKQAQEKQMNVLARLAAFVEASQNKAPVQKAAFIQH